MVNSVESRLQVEGVFDKVVNKLHRGLDAEQWFFYDQDWGASSFEGKYVILEKDVFRRGVGRRIMLIREQERLDVEASFYVIDSGILGRPMATIVLTDVDDVKVEDTRIRFTSQEKLGRDVAQKVLEIEQDASGKYRLESFLLPRNS